MLCDRKLLFSEESSLFQDHLQNYERFMYDLNAEVTEKLCMREYISSFFWKCVIMKQKLVLHTSAALK